MKTVTLLSAYEKAESMKRSLRDVCRNKNGTNHGVFYKIPEFRKKERQASRFKNEIVRRLKQYEGE